VKKSKRTFQVIERIICCKEIYRVRENPMFKLCEVIEETENKIHCQGTVGRRCVLAVPRTAKVGLTKV